MDRQIDYLHANIMGVLIPRELRAEWTRQVHAVKRGLVKWNGNSELPFRVLAQKMNVMLLAHNFGREDVQCIDAVWIQCLINLGWTKDG